MDTFFRLQVYKMLSALFQARNGNEPSRFPLLLFSPLLLIKIAIPSRFLYWAQWRQYPSNHGANFARKGWMKGSSHPPYFVFFLPFPPSSAQFIPNGIRYKGIRESSTKVRRICRIKRKHLETAPLSSREEMGGGFCVCIDSRWYPNEGDTC